MAQTSIQKHVGARLRAIRKEKGLTQEALEEKGISSRYYSRIERGTVNPTLGTLENICRKLGVKVEDLFQFTDLKRKQSADEIAIAKQVGKLLRSGDKETISKLRVFLEQIL